ncbi:hypothetical protein CC80DRAFT_554061 [Byssothecium circinans]|uniref:Uncharacterized protein n=1 Tax=Byssothecium circinans TaxID=147558 RepID=A0A6A5TEP8_9PLEO|nr:hypothetical protein CC80DRAFT_554061 [Byssothecium circinans]
MSSTHAKGSARDAAQGSNDPIVFSDSAFSDSGSEVEGQSTNAKDPKLLTPPSGSDSTDDVAEVFGRQPARESHSLSASAPNNTDEKTHIFDTETMDQAMADLNAIRSRSTNKFPVRNLERNASNRAPSNDKHAVTNPYNPSAHVDRVLHNFGEKSEEKKKRDMERDMDNREKREQLKKEAIQMSHDRHFSIASFPPGSASDGSDLLLRVGRAEERKKAREAVTNKNKDASTARISVGGRSARVDNDADRADVVANAPEESGSKPKAQKKKTQGEARDKEGTDLGSLRPATLADYHFMLTLCIIAVLFWCWIASSQSRTAAANVQTNVDGVVTVLHKLLQPAQPTSTTTIAQAVAEPVTQYITTTATTTVTVTASPSPSPTPLPDDSTPVPRMTNDKLRESDKRAKKQEKLKLKKEDLEKKLHKKARRYPQDEEQHRNDMLDGLSVFMYVALAVLADSCYRGAISWKGLQISVFVLLLVGVVSVLGDTVG